MFEDIIDIINNIGKMHKDFSETFFSDHKALDLKKLTVAKVVDETSYDEEFISLIEDYIEELAFFQIFQTFQSKNDLIETRNRGKNRESALNKLYHCRFSNQDPSIPIQKIINDLLGFRIIISDNFDHNDLLEKINNFDGLSTKLFRPYVREDYRYLAIHIYFNSGNKLYFPWELQIWRKSEEKSNELSHEMHKEKRKYINWTELFKDNKYGEE